MILNEKKALLRRKNTDTLAKASQNIFVYSFVSEHYKYFSLFEKKT